jgi:uncharacterized protein
MIVDLKTILHGPRQFDLTFDPDWWRDDEDDNQILGLDGPLKSSIRISKAGSKFVVDGSLSGTLQLRCDRCLDSFHSDLKSDFRLFLSLPSSVTDQSELELLEEDMAVDFIIGDEIDLSEVVRGQIYLSLPMKTLCGEECLGLCPVCGANLNLEACDCRRQSGHPGFTELKKLRLNKG